MNHLLGLLVLTGFLLGAGTQVQAQTLRARTGLPSWSIVPEKKWSGYFRYNIASDYAMSESPRAYDQVLGGGVKYDFNENLSMSGDFSAQMQTVNGQVEKNPEETKAESLNPSTAVELDYRKTFADTHAYTLFVHAEPLWDEPSRLEGYKGIGGVGGSLDLGFFKKRYMISNVLDISELLNTYRYNLAEDPNPDMYYTFRMTHAVRLYKTIKAAYSVGVKLTRYLDASTTYNYNNAFSLSYTWRALNVAIAYMNGGYTDDGSVKFWYLDEYRRIGQLKMSYSF